MSEIRNRGTGDILIALVDGLKGFPEAISAVFPETIVQTCIVHLIRSARVLLQGVGDSVEGWLDLEALRSDAVSRTPGPFPCARHTSRCPSSSLLPLRFAA